MRPCPLLPGLELFLEPEAKKSNPSQVCPASSLSALPLPCSDLLERAPCISIPQGRSLRYCESIPLTARRSRFHFRALRHTPLHGGAHPGAHPPWSELWEKRWAWWHVLRTGLYKVAAVTLNAAYVGALGQ